MAGLIAFVAFQFHSGLIKSRDIGINITIIRPFQFHSGLIKSACDDRAYDRNRGVSIPFWSD